VLYPRWHHHHHLLLLLLLLFRPNQMSKSNLSRM
jgi:hypothetical protein